MTSLLFIAIICEANKGELVAHKGLWYGKGFLFSSILLDVIKVTGVDVTAQFRHHRGSSYQKHKRLIITHQVHDEFCDKLLNQRFSQQSQKIKIQV